MFTSKENLEDLTNEDLDKYILEITADKSTLEPCSNKLFDLVKKYVDKKRVENRYEKDINLEYYKPIHDFDEDKLKNILSKIWEHIECNFDKKVQKVIIIGTDAQFYTSYLLDDSQKERLMDSFNIICGVDSSNDFTLISLDI